MKWYLQRLKTMDIRELVYRIRQQYNYHINRKNKGSKIKLKKIGNVKREILSPIVIPKQLDNIIQIFEKEINFNIIPNWHLDLSTKKEFPKKYAFDIDIRTDKNGSAKYVWEVNRMLFLPRIAVNYKHLQDKNHLELFIKHIQSWKEHNPYLIGVNWYSNIEVNIRLINWALSWEILDAPELMKSNLDFKAFVENDWMPLIYQHCIYSSKFPSLFSSANNHLISEYAGLFIANCIWEFPESKQWLAESQSGLEKEIQKQHTNEGVNREEAAEYIQFITDFFLMAYIFGKKCANSFSQKYQEKLIEVFDYILYFLDINGNFPQYGDEDDGRLTSLNTESHASNFDSILVSAAIITQNAKYKLPRLQIDNKNLILFGNDGNKLFESLNSQKVDKSSFFPESGHFIFRKMEANKEIFLHFDVAPLGYLSIAAHGHADALSLILHVDGKPVLVDSGTYTYHTHPEWRNYFISTKAHNTVCINGLNQCVNGGALLWLKHYQTVVDNFHLDDSIDSVEGRHDGYSSLGYIHKRRIEFDKDSQVFTIHDTILSEKIIDTLIEIPWHFHPECELGFDNQKYSIERKEVRGIVITMDEKLKSEIVFGNSKPILGWYSESFYKKQPTHTIIGKFQGKILGSIVFTTTIEIKKT